MTLSNLSPIHEDGLNASICISKCGLAIKAKDDVHDDRIRRSCRKNHIADAVVHLFTCRFGSGYIIAYDLVYLLRDIVFPISECLSNRSSFIHPFKGRRVLLPFYFNRQRFHFVMYGLAKTTHIGITIYVTLHLTKP